MKKKIQIWARFEDGLEVKIEIAPNMKAAQSAIDAMNHSDQRDLAEGYGFPHGLPEYFIKA